MAAAISAAEARKEDGHASARFVEVITAVIERVELLDRTIKNDEQTSARRR